MGEPEPEERGELRLISIQDLGDRSHCVASVGACVVCDC